LLGGEELMRQSRKPAIMGDAAYYIFTSPSTECTGNFFIDDKVLLLSSSFSSLFFSWY